MHVYIAFVLYAYLLPMGLDSGVTLAHLNARGARQPISVEKIFFLNNTKTIIE